MIPFALLLQALQRVIQVAMAATAGQDEADEDDENDANPFLDEPRALKVRNLSPSVNAEQVRQLFGYCGKVVECSIADGEAYVEFEKPEEATAALQLNGIAVGDREVQVEHTKLVLKKKGKKDPGGVASSLQLMQQVCVAAALSSFLPFPSTFLHFAKALNLWWEVEEASIPVSGV